MTESEAAFRQRTEANRATALEFMARLSAGDVDGFIALYHPDATLWTSGQTLISGTYSRAQIAASADAVLEAFPQGLRFEVQATTAEGDRVAIEAVSEGQHASGQVYRNRYHFLFRFRDGQVIQLKEYMDTEAVTEVLCGGQRPGSQP